MLSTLFLKSRRNSGFALAVVVILGLGIGANTATLSLLYGYLLAPLPYRQAGRLVEVHVTSRAFPRHTFGVTYGTYAALRASAAGMADWGMSEARSFNLESGSRQEHVLGSAVSASFAPAYSARTATG